MADGNKEFIIKMLQLFITETDGALKELTAGIKNQDGLAIAAICHKSLPSCRHMKLWDMVEQFSMMEEDVKNGEIEKAEDIFRIMKDQWKATKKALQNEITRMAGKSGVQ